MKTALLALCAALMLASAIAPTMVEAKSTKWRCYSPDPLNPDAYVCVLYGGGGN